MKHHLQKICLEMLYQQLYFVKMYKVMIINLKNLNYYQQKYNWLNLYFKIVMAKLYKFYFVIITELSFDQN